MKHTQTRAAASPKYWVKGDWAAYFGLLVNNLTNLLTMISLLTIGVGLPTSMVIGRIAPAFGLAVFLASVWYTILAVRMQRKTGRNDITVLPSGPSAPSIFTVTFLVLMPVYQTTKSPEFALSIGLVWCMVEASILVIGSFVGDWLRRMIPRTVLLSCLAGLGLLLLAMNPMLQSFASPVVAFVVLVLIFMNWFGRKPLFAKIPTGLLLLIVGTATAWALGLMSPEAIGVALAEAGFQPPTLHITNVIDGIPVALPYLASALPLGLANYVFDLENIESAHAAGDPYDTKAVMLGNGITSMLGAFFGNPFPVTVYVGHVGWKALGARLGYSLATGTSMLIFGIFSLGGVLLSIIPMAAVAPILIFIGVVTANQVVRETPRVEVPVIFISLFPWIANWALTLVGNVLKAAGTNAGEVGAEALQKAGVEWAGISALGNGAPLASIMWGCITMFAIRNQSIHGAVASAVAAVLAGFGVIHSAALGWGGGQTMWFFAAYLAVAAIFLLKYFTDGKNRGAVDMPEHELPQASKKDSSKEESVDEADNADKADNATEETVETAEEEAKA
ncbi:MAG: hypothetical protein Q4G30_06115 [Actinomycetaceae bacterium]|nr:hypothetical protein [Actinomycetaceae bacterium]